VVAQGAGVVAAHGHEAVVQEALVFVEVGGALEDVAGVEHQDVGGGGADLPDQGGAAGDAPAAGEVAAAGPEGLDAGVGVVGVQEGDPARARGVLAQQGQAGGGGGGPEGLEEGAAFHG